MKIFVTYSWNSVSNLLLRKTNQRFGPGVRLGCLMLGNISFKRKIGKNTQLLFTKEEKNHKKARKSKDSVHITGIVSRIVCKLKARTFKKFEKTKILSKG